ncbi:MAG: hypothetical protein ACO1N0_02590 [Fluviicola sp.]
MKKILFITFILTNSISFCQEYFGYERSMVISEYRQMEFGKSFQVEIIDDISTFTVLMSGNDSFAIKHFFRPNKIDGEITDESICDSLVFDFFCVKCLDQHLQELLHSKQRKWVKLSDSLFLSKKWISKFMPAGKDPNLFTFPMMQWERTGTSTKVLIYPKTMTKEVFKKLIAKK